MDWRMHKSEILSYKLSKHVPDVVYEAFQGVDMICNMALKRGNNLLTKHQQLTEID